MSFKNSFEITSGVATYVGPYIFHEEMVNEANLLYVYCVRNSKLCAPSELRIEIKKS